jgi:hypothetical protein
MREVSAPSTGRISTVTVNPVGTRWCGAEYYAREETRRDAAKQDRATVNSLREKGFDG